MEFILTINNYRNHMDRCYGRRCCCVEIEGVLKKMVFYRSCPKCRGDMHARLEFYGDFKECLQCGLLQDLEKKTSVEMVGSSAAGKSSDDNRGRKGEAA